jgi:hypothetical protein
MMKRILKIWAKTASLLFLFALSLSAQTTVNLSVTDTPDNQTWNNGTWSVNLTMRIGNNPSGVYTIISGGGSTAPQSGALSATGTAAIALPANANIAPADSIWVFQVCPQASSPCYQQQVTVVATSPQTVALTPPSIRINMFTAIPPVAAYADGELTGVKIGNVYYNLPGALERICQATSGNNCTTWVNNGGGGGGGSGTVQPGGQFFLPIYPASGSNPIIGPSNIRTGTSLNDLTVPGVVTANAIIDQGLTPSTSPICPNGAGGQFTTTGCSGGGGGGGSPPGGTTNAIQKNGGGGAFAAAAASDDGTNFNITDFLNPNGNLTGGTAALKFQSSASARYAAPYGNNANDGLSWGSPKHSLDKALEALPGGDGVVNAGHGTVYFLQGTVPCEADASYGVMLMGNTDPNYVTPPTCWVKTSQNAGVALRIEGVPSSNSAKNAIAFTGQTTSNDRNKPGIWLSGVQQPVDFENYGSQYQGRGVVGAECSNNDRTGTCPVSSITFHNVATYVNTVAGTGPNWDFPQGYWIWAEDIFVNANTLNAPGDPKRAAMLLNIGLGHIKNVRIGGNGGIVVPTGGVNNMDFNGIFLDGAGGGVCDPVVWFQGPGGSGYTVKNVSNSDCGSPSYGVEVDNAETAQDVIVEGIQGQNGNVKGMATVLGQLAANNLDRSIDPILEGQNGFIHDHAYGEVDVARAAFDTEPVLFANEATGGIGGTLVPGDPFGSSNASRITAIVDFWNPSRTYAAGDYVIFGGWLKAPDGSFLSDIPIQWGWDNVACPTVTFSDQGHYMHPYTLVNATSWYWIYGWVKVGGSGGACNLKLSRLADATHREDGYGFVINYIPASYGWTDSTTRDYANNLKSYDPSCALHSACNLPIIPYILGGVSLSGGSVSAGGSGTFGGTVTAGGNPLVANPMLGKGDMITGGSGTAPTVTFVANARDVSGTTHPTCVAPGNAACAGTGGTFTTAVGSTIVVMTGYGNGAPTQVTGVADTLGNTFTRVGGGGSGAVGSVETWKSCVTTGGSDVVTVSYTAGLAYIGLTVDQINGAPCSTLDGTSFSNSGNSTNPRVNFSTSNANDVTFAVAFTGGGITGALTGATLDDNAGFIGVSHQIWTSPQTTNTMQFSSGSANWEQMVQSFAFPSSSPARVPAYSGSGTGVLTETPGNTPAFTPLTSGPVAAKPTSTDGVMFVSTTGNDANDGTSGGSAKLTVQAAHNALPAGGGTLNLAAGSYSGAITISKPIKITCAQPNGTPSTTLTIPNAANTNVITLTSTGTLSIDRCVIDGNSANQTTTSYLVASSAAVSNLYLTNSVLQNGLLGAINFTAGASASYITGNVFSNNGTAGATVFDVHIDTGSNSTSWVHIEDNLFNSNAGCVSLTSQNGAMIGMFENYVASNTCDTNSGATAASTVGINITGNTTAGQSSELFIIGNTFRNFASSLTAQYYIVGSNIYDSEITNNILLGRGTMTVPGVQLTSSNNNSISRNNFDSFNGTGDGGASIKIADSLSTNNSIGLNQINTTSTTPIIDNGTGTLLAQWINGDFYTASILTNKIKLNGGSYFFGGTAANTPPPITSPILGGLFVLGPRSLTMGYNVNATAWQDFTTWCTSTPVAGHIVTVGTSYPCIADSGVATGAFASGTATMGTSAVASGTCATVVTVSATGVATTDTITWNPNVDPTAVTGYGPSATGNLYIWAYPTANNISFKVCNSTSASITPSALTLNWKVVR